MFKNKKMSLFFAALLAITLTLTACGGKSSKEKLTESVSKLSDLESYTQNMSLSLNVETPETADPSAAMMMSILNSAKLDLTAKANIKDMTQSGKINVAFSGMEYPLDFFYTTEKMMFKTPFDERYVNIDFPAEMKDAYSADNMDLYKKMSDKMMNSLISKVDDKNISEASETVDGESYTAITLAPTTKEMIESLKEVYTLIYTDETMRPMMIANTKSQMSMMGVEMSDEEIAAQLDESHKTMNESLDMMAEHVDFTGSTVKVLINKDELATGFDATIAVKVSAPDESGDMSLTYKINGMLTDINSTVVDAMPEVTEDQTMSAQEFMQILMGAFLGGGLE
jgi:outer membrane lipoprotein-sorting protein